MIQEYTNYRAGCTTVARATGSGEIEIALEPGRYAFGSGGRHGERFGIFGAGVETEGSAWRVTAPGLCHVRFAGAQELWREGE